MQNALLWKLKYPSGIESYLFGTMHVRDRVAFAYAQNALEYMEKCSHYYAEIDLRKAAIQISMNDYMLPGELCWNHLLPQRVYGRMLKHSMQVLNFNLEEWVRFFPLVVSNKMAEWIMAEDEELALDAFLFFQAFKKRKRLGGVEDVSFQLKLMQSININEQLRILKKQCRKLSAFRAFVEELKIDYKNQDIHNLFSKTRKSLGAMKSIMLKERNTKMAHTIAGHSDNAGFYAIGAAHLAGRYGVLRYLKKKSIKLEPLSI